MDSKVQAGTSAWSRHWGLPLVICFLLGGLFTGCPPPPVQVTQPTLFLDLVEGQAAVRLDPATAAVASFQVDLRFVAGMPDGLRVTAGAGATSAGRVVRTERVNSDTVRAVVYGMDRSGLAAGDMLVISASSPIATLPVLQNAMGASPSAETVALLVMP